MSAARRLVGALVASARAAGCTLRVSSACERPWSSATFVGARHTIGIDGEPGDALTEWLAGLSEAAIAVRGHVVAEVIVRHSGAGATLSALTLED